jgi:hypothetical protein
VSSEEEPPLEKVTFDPSGKAAQALRKTAALTGLSQTDVLNRACLVYEVVSEHVASGADLWFLYPSGPGWFGRHVPRRKSVRVPNKTLAAGTGDYDLTSARARPRNRG